MNAGKKKMAWANMCNAPKTAARCQEIKTLLEGCEGWYNITNMVETMYSYNRALCADVDTAREFTLQTVHRMLKENSQLLAHYTSCHGL